MSNHLQEELENVEQLIYQAKFKDSLTIISDLEKKEHFSSENQLFSTILKGKICCYKDQYKLAIDLGQTAYQLSQNYGTIFDCIDSLILKAHILYFGKIDEAYNCILECEKLLRSSSAETTLKVLKKEADLLLIKSIFYHKNTDHDKALELALEWLSKSEYPKEKLDISRIYCHLANIYIFKSNPNEALDYAMKSLNIQKGLINQVGIASSLYLVGLSYYSKGEFDQALKSGKESLANEKISIYTKLKLLHLLGAIYREKGDIDRTLKFYKKAVIHAEEGGYIEDIIENTMSIGAAYRMKGDLDQASIYLQRSIETAQKYNSPYGISGSLFFLILTDLDKHSQKQAETNLAKLEEFADKSKSKVFDQLHMIAKALVLKNSGRIRNRTEAELLLKQIAEDEISTPQLYLMSLVNLSELFLEELEMTNNPEVLYELNPLISRLSKIAEKENAYLWLAEIKLLQAKLALIQAEIRNAEQLLTQAQQIAEIHGLNLLAIKISSEHDNLLEQLNFWNNLEKENVPMSERIKLASVDGVIDRMQGKGVVKPLEPSHEKPVLLLIIGEGGFPLFSNSFTKEWDFEGDLISGFLSAFDSFSGELFAKRLDRAKFGDYIILMQSVNKFSVCYLFKGQTYLAKQKLSKFVDSIKNSRKIWETINNYYHSNRVIELKDHPAIELLINEIFIRKIPELVG
ncbi:MAG: tetratricopeptide repeat protein [Candidatus Hermodarchaeota archaeon]